ncbi:hypothetical protein BJY00DRAFT_278824 [Aspergillus carlsbadensis]|nr:hypothetical protein BJY00DRAFT_278824 [Aspergillus carlsbadensis]
MHIRSTLPLDCGPLDDRFGDGGRDAGYYYDCESASESRGSRLLMQGNAAVGVVFGVVGSMNLLGLGLW